MSEIDIVNEAIKQAAATKASRLLIAGGVLDAETDLPLGGEKTLGDYIPGGVKALKGRYLVGPLGQVAEA